MKVLALNRLRPASTVEDRKDFAECFNATLNTLGVKPGEEFLIASASVLEERAPRAGKCRWCNEPVDPERAWRRESGYVKPRAIGGTNALALREQHLEDVACDRCVDRMKRGVSPGQESLA